MALLWFGSAVVEHIALLPAFSTQYFHATMSSGAVADYRVDVVGRIAPVGGELARSIRREMIDLKDYAPLPWGQGYA